MACGCGCGTGTKCNGCVTGTGRPGTLSNVTTTVNGAVVPNWSTLDQIQRQIQRVVRVQSSEYAANKAALVDPTDHKGVAIKHNSYVRYLNRIKGFSADSASPNLRPPPLRGAKNTTFSIVRCRCK